VGYFPIAGERYPWNCFRFNASRLTFQPMLFATQTAVGPIHFP
jgi:hypothetical protein